MDRRGQWICLRSQFLGYATVVNLNRTKSFLFGLKCTKITSGWGSPKTPLGELTALPRPHSCWKEEEGRGEDERGGEGRGGDFAILPPNLNFLATPLIDFHFIQIHFVTIAVTVSIVNTFITNNTVASGGGGVLAALHLDGGRWMMKTDLVTWNILHVVMFQSYSKLGPSFTDLALPVIRRRWWSDRGTRYWNK